MAITKGANFPAEVISDLFTKVQGHSTLAKLSQQVPIAFSGSDIFTFSMDDEVNLVAEGGVKASGAAAAEPVHMVPLKIEYGARVTDEFMYAAEERQLEILKAFNDGFGKKAARGLDIMAMHGMNPRTAALATALIGTNSFDTNTGVATVTYTAADPESNLEDAIAALGDYDVTGYALSKAFATAMGKLKVNGVKQYPEFALGGNPGALGGHAADVNSTVSFAASGATSVDHAIVGDFTNAFKWGYARDVMFEIIPYGDPDQSGSDLKAHNQVYLRAEAYIGWGILDPAAFVRIKT
ncbi:MAG: phage major capsid protein [Lachnospiraceae bacterium]|nr:phage major capsid protein [Lachnospiraceae bacterium]